MLSHTWRLAQEVRPTPAPADRRGCARLRAHSLKIAVLGSREPRQVQPPLSHSVRWIEEFLRRCIVFVLQDPFFWAFVGMFGLLVGVAIVSGIKLGQNALLGFTIIMISDSSRIILVLPFCFQPRFEIGVWSWIVGGIILAAAMVFGVPALSINWRTAPDSNMTLKTNGIYSVVRNPIYLADILFSLGFAIMFRSIIGVVLVPIWWAAFLVIVLVEEVSLERALGQPYLDFKHQVKGRIIPGLPI